MQLGITGLAKSGKTTLFNLLTSSHETTDKFAKSTEAHVAVTRVPDRRLAALRDLFEPKKYTPATVQFVDVPGVTDVERIDLDRAVPPNVTVQVGQPPLPLRGQRRHSKAQRKRIDDLRWIGRAEGNRDQRSQPPFLLERTRRNQIANEVGAINHRLR